MTNSKFWQLGIKGILAAGMLACIQNASGQESGKSGVKLDEIRRATTLMKHKVVNKQSETLGSIKDVVFDKAGKAHYAIVDHGGILADKYVAVPWGVLNPQFDAHHCVLDMSVSKLQGAPTFEKGNYNDRWTKQWCGQVHEYFGDTKSSQSTDSAKEHELFYASQVLGGTIQNKDDRKLAKVADLIFDSEGRVAFVVIGSGGTLNIGKNYVAVPFSALQWKRGEQGTAYGVMDMTAAQIEGAPMLTKSDYSDLLNEAFSAKTTQYFTAVATQ